MERTIEGLDAPGRRRVGVLGGSSLVGRSVIDILKNRGCEVFSFSREIDEKMKMSDWVLVAPIWVLPGYFKSMSACGARRVVALSSTSVFTKQNSPEKKEQNVVEALKTGEDSLARWSEQSGVAYVILRPTLIYGGEDKNISVIAGFIKKFGFFPMVGGGRGLRQPIHKDDVAAALVDVLFNPNVVNKAFNITGSETLTYESMVRRVFDAMERKSRIVRIPLLFARVFFRLLRIWPRWRGVNFAMVTRMNENLVFDSTDAKSCFGFTSRPFQPTQTAKGPENT